MDTEAKEKAKQKTSHEEKPAATQFCIEDTVKRMKKYTKGRETYQRITWILAMFVVIGYVANSIVDNEEFRDFIAELEMFPIVLLSQRK